jgi:hypothetical protein
MKSVYYVYNKLNRCFTILRHAIYNQPPSNLSLYRPEVQVWISCHTRVEKGKLWTRLNIFATRSFNLLALF